MAVQAGAANSKNLRDAEPVAVAHLQNFLDVQFADFIKAERTPFFVGGQVTGAMLGIFRQVGNVNEITHGGDAGGGDDIFEFADVAGPGMLEKNGLRAASEPGDIFGVSFIVFFEKELNEERNIFQTLGERRDTDLDGIQAIERVLAKTSSQNFGAKIAIGGGEQADVYPFHSGRAETLNFAVLNDVQEFGLHG